MLERVFGLDLLRCVAVLMVVSAHTRFFLRPFWPQTKALSLFGYLGVELFFVLSGFLIGGILLKSFGDAPTAGTLGRFWVRRWLRTLPNYYLFLLINFLLPREQPVERPAAYFLFLQNLAWRCPAFFNESWSLAVEEWFYLAFPLLLLGASRLKPERRFAFCVALGALALLSIGARIAAVAAGEPHWDADVRKVVLYRFDALMIGVLGALAKAYGPEAWRRLRSASALAGVATSVLVVISYYGLERNASFFFRTFFFTLTSVAVLLFLPALDAWRRATGWLAECVRAISLWSYSLYLVHLPVHNLLVHAFGDPRQPGAAPDLPGALAMTAAFVGLSILLSWLTYRCFEKPVLDLRERFARRTA